LLLSRGYSALDIPGDTLASHMDMYARASPVLFAFITMPDKEELYKRIKIAGLILYIPIMLLAGPMSGFFLGDYLQRKFHLPYFVLIILICLGLAVGIEK